MPILEVQTSSLDGAPDSPPGPTPRRTPGISLPLSCVFTRPLLSRIYTLLSVKSGLKMYGCKKRDKYEVNVYVPPSVMFFMMIMSDDECVACSNLLPPYIKAFF